MNTAAHAAPGRPRPSSAGHRHLLPSGLVVPLLALLPLSAGCVTADPIALWQSRVEEFVRAEGHGDPNGLRTTGQLRDYHGDRPGRATFGTTDVVVSALPFEKRDVQGLLLGRRVVGGRSWYVYLVALCRPQQFAGTQMSPGELIDSIALLAFHTDDGNTFTWVAADGTTEAIERYRAARAETHAADSPRCLFPGRADVFRLRKEGDRLVVTHAGSPARWTLDVPPEPNPQDTSQPRAGSSAGR